MKALPLYIFGLSLLFVFSCKKDDSHELILGNWKRSLEKIRECDDPTENKEKVFINGCYHYELEYTICQEVTFNADKSFTFITSLINSISTEVNTTVGNYMIKSNQLTLCFGLDNSNCDTGIFIVSDNSLSLIDFLENVNKCIYEFNYVK